MSRTNSKAKGGAFERKICKQLSLWWSGNVSADLCWRSASSGAVGTVRRSKVAGYHGDIVAVDPSIQPLFDLFSIELKHYKSLDIAEPLRDCKSQIMEFWRQTLKSARMSLRLPILIFKSNRRPEIIAVPMLLIGFLKDRVKHLNYITYGNRVAMLNLTDVLEVVPPGVFNEPLLRQVLLRAANG